MHTELYELDQSFYVVTCTGDIIDSPWAGEGVQIRSRFDVHVLRFRPSRCTHRLSVIDVHVVWTEPLDYILALPTSKRIILSFILIKNW